MNRIAFLTISLLLAGCANDHYSVIPGTAASDEKMADDLRACKHEALDKYEANRDHTGLIAGTLIGGAIGGAVAGAIDSSSNQGMKPSDIDPEIERCMAGRGYVGTSEN
jgi:outer membrane lipoprotein SlyB